MGKKMAKAYIGAGPEGGNKMMARFDDVTLSMSEPVDSFLQQTILDINQKSTDQVNAAVSTPRSFLLGSLFIAAALVVLFFVIDRSLRRLPVAVEKIQKIAAGDLTASVKCGFQYEISEVLDAVDIMRQDLLSMIKQIIMGTVKLSATSDSLTQAINRVGHTSTEQQSETAAIATAIHQVTVTVQEVSNNINVSLQATLLANQDSHHEQAETMAMAVSYFRVGY